MAHFKLVMALVLCVGLTTEALAQQAKWKQRNQQAQKLYQQGKYAEAIPISQRALEVAEKTFGPNHANVAESLNRLGLLYSYQEKYYLAEPLLKRALGTYEKALGREHAFVGTALNNLALLYWSQKRLVEAEPLFKRSLAIYEKTLGREHPNAAASMHNLASLYLYQGKYAEAGTLCKRALAIREKALGPNHPDVAHSLHSLSVLYSWEGKKAEAERLSRRSLAIREKALGPNHPDVADSLNNLGQLRADQGDQKTAIEYFERSLAIYMDKGLAGAYTTRNYMAHLHMDLGDFTAADLVVRGCAWPTTRGRYHLLTGDYDAAIHSYEMIRRKAQQNRDAANLSAMYTGLGLAYEGLGQNAKAAEHYRKAMGSTEELRSSLGRAERERFFETRELGFSRMSPYEGLARVLLKMDKPVEALKSSEYGKARVFAERISARLRHAPLDVPLEVLKKDIGLNDQISALKRQREIAYKEASRDRIQALELQVAEVRQQLSEHIKMLRERYPRFAAAKYPEPMDLSQSALRKNEQVLEYHVTDSGVIVYLTKGKTLVRAEFKPISRKGLEELVSKFRKPLDLAGGDRSPTQLVRFDFDSGKKLADLLLGDILHDLPKDAPLIIVPDGPLGVVPFEMLVLNEGGKIFTDKAIPYVTGADFFGDRNPISYYQSITALTLARTLGKQQKPGHRTLAMVDPVFSTHDARLVKAASKRRRTALDKLTGEKLMSFKTELGLEIPRLPLTTQLGESLKKADPEMTDLYNGLKAQKAVLFEKDLKPYHSVVFGTHGYFGKNLPGIQEPVLILTLPDQPEGQDGFLRMTEVMNLKLNCDVAALTACQTGLGRHISGEGTMGMGRAFQYAGAKSVLMSLWSVAESSSVDLVTSFFKHLREGKNKLEALKLAREEIRKAGYDHPFFWAPFILVGEVD